MDLAPNQRATLSGLLHDIMDPLDGKVYYNPPENTSLVYPCFIYKLADIYVQRADDGPYSLYDQYQLTFIHQDVDSPVVRQLMQLEYIQFDRRFHASGLVHDVFVIYHP